MCHYDRSGYERRLRGTVALASGCWLRSVAKPSGRNTIGDRLIPTRAGNNWLNTFYAKEEEYLDVDELSGASRNRRLLNSLLSNEILDTRIENRSEMQSKRPNVLRYGRALKSASGGEPSHSASPLSSASQKFLQCKNIAKRPDIVATRTLVAAELAADLSYNLVDWSSHKMVGIGLSSVIMLWNSETSEVTPMCDLALCSDVVASLSWAQKGSLLAAGTGNGYVEVWDTLQSKRIHELRSHNDLVASLAWYGHILASGCNEGVIRLKDIRSPASIVNQTTLEGHTGQVCGLKWSPDGHYLASGGDDSQLLVWDIRSLKQPLHRFNEHRGAVRAIAWSPHQRGVVASGGGRDDRRIHFWNILSGQALPCIETGDEVCSLAWSPHATEIVSVQAYTNRPVIVWKYPKRVPVAHVLSPVLKDACTVHFTTSPDGETIVTGTNNQLLMFWKVFCKMQEDTSETRSLLNLFTSLR